MNHQSYKLAVRGLRMSLLMLPLILIVPMIIFLFPQIEDEALGWLSKAGKILIWAGVGLGAAGLLMFLYNRSAVPQDKRLQLLFDIKPFLWLNLLAIGGFLCLALLRA